MATKSPLILLALVLACSPCYAAFTIADGRLVTVEQAMLKTSQCHFEKGWQAIRQRDWDTAIRQYDIIISNYPESPEAHGSLYFLAICNYYISEFDIANEYFSAYLKSPYGRDYFESAVEYKLAIANQFSKGERRHFFGKKYLPCWLSAEDQAIELYDEVSTTLPCHDLATWALYCKGRLLWKMGRYYESIDTLQQLTRRFPKHELAPESYVTISYIYLNQCEKELHNSDLLAFAQINMRKFEQDFPREERLITVEKNLLGMQELYAKSLYETGEYYERKEESRAACIYYKNVLDRYPETCMADQSRNRLSVIQKCPEKI